MRKTVIIGGWLRVIILCVFSATALHAAENLKINPRLNYNSDSQDGPLITGDRMQDGPENGKPNYVLMYGEG